MTHMSICLTRFLPKISCLSLNFRKFQRVTAMISISIESIEDIFPLTAGKVHILIYSPLPNLSNSFYLYVRFMGINDYGTQWILKRRLAKYMNYLNEDDKVSH